MLDAVFGDPGGALTCWHCAGACADPPAGAQQGCSLILAAIYRPAASNAAQAVDLRSMSHRLLAGSVCWYLMLA